MTEGTVTTVKAVANERNCLYCGKFLESGKGRPKKYCSDAHRKRYERQTDREIRYCPIDGKPLVNKDGTPKKANAVYCSNRCRQIHFQRETR
jgi:endogenous inhibitor of DNA gyrase (YacG/DUF329 family)